MESTQQTEPDTSEAILRESLMKDNSKSNHISDTYLESLGFVITNGKPRFILDEPTLTVSHVNTIQTVDSNTVDEDNSLSFIVLGKDSIDAIQASSLASYVDIQQKSMSIDYNSVTSLNAAEVQQKLTELLQENMKLKETLKQNSVAMKQQFNNLAIWQEEVMKVHQRHKQQFAETREYINQLKKENIELKIKLSTPQTERTEHEFEVISTTSISNTKDVSADKINLQKKISILTEELANYKLHCSKLVEDVERYKNLSNVMNTNLEQTTREIEKQLLKVKKLELQSAIDSCCNCNQSSTKTIETQEGLEASLAKDVEITHLKESIVLLEQKLQCVLTPMQLHDLSESTCNQNRQKFVQNMKQYNDRLQALTECFVSQIDRFNVIEKSLKETADILEKLSYDKSCLKNETTESYLPLADMQFDEYRTKLCDCLKKLSDEQVQIITDRQTLIKSQSQFQQILSDYNSILYELEIMVDENAKLNALRNSRQNLQKIAEIEKFNCDKQLLKEEKEIFEIDKDNLEKNKKLLQNVQKDLDMERESLLNEKVLLQQQKINLNEEKTSLDQQSHLYETYEKAVQDEKKLVDLRYKELSAEMESIREEMIKKNVELKEVLEQEAQSREEINIFRTQLQYYEEDFKREKEYKEMLLEEKSKLDMELQKQITFNEELQQEISYLTSGNSNNATPQNNHECPKCKMVLSSMRNMMEHIEECLNLP